MAFITFREDQKKARTKLFALIIGIAVFFVGYKLLIMDIATTGAFWDSLGLQPVLPNTFHPYGVSTEGWIVATLISGFQIYASYQIAHMQPKSQKQTTWIILRFVSAVVDTFTDIDYRSYGFSTPEKAIASTIISIIAFNIGSEWAVTAGFGMIAENFASAFPFLAELLKAFKEMWKFASEIMHGEKSKGGGGGDNHKVPDHGPRPEPMFGSHKPPQRPGNNSFASTSPAPVGGANPRELAGRKNRDEMKDDEFMAQLKKLPGSERRVVMAELTPENRNRIGQKMAEEMKGVGAPFGGRPNA